MDPTAVKVHRRIGYGQPYLVDARPLGPSEAMPGSVLIVDDDERFRALASRTLTAWGHAPIHEAATVADALRDAVALHPDTVVIDVGLPDGDGFALAAELAAMTWRPLIVVVSSEDDTAYHHAAERAGAAGFVTKVDLPDERARDLLAGL